MFRKYPIQYLGRWRLEGRKKTNLKAYYANEEIIIPEESIIVEKFLQKSQLNCGVCLIQSNDKKKQEEEYYSVFMVEHIPTIVIKK